MKSLFLVMLALAISLAGDSVRDGTGMQQRVDFSGSALQFVNAILRHQETPFTGLVTEHFANGALKLSATYRDGKQHGIERLWYENGQPSSIRFYENGKKIGHIGPGGRMVLRDLCIISSMGNIMVKIRNGIRRVRCFSYDIMNMEKKPARKKRGERTVNSMSITSLLTA